MDLGGTRVDLGASFLAHGWQSRPTDGGYKNIVNTVNTVIVVNTVMKLCDN